jgi:hypothetical protein
MDKELLAALNNVSSAIEHLSKMLAKKGDSKEKKSDTTKALQSGKLDEHLMQIDKTLKEISKDNKEILKRQDTIIQLSKQKPAEKDPLAKASDPKQKNKLKDGLASIMMIAVGVLAIGAAFKLIGKVNFPSVIALAIALPLVAMAFEKIAQMTHLKGGNIAKLLLVTVTIATAIAISSRILKFVQPVGIFQLITSIFIAGMFATVSYSIGRLFEQIKDLDPKSAWKLPIIMVAVAAAIVGSSYLLGAVKPVGLFQLITSVFIAAMFGAVSFGLGKLMSAFKDINPADALEIGLVLPLVMVAVAYAIQMSSVPLSKVQPIGLFQFFTAVMIAIVFIPISFALKYIGEGIKDLDLGKIATLPVILVLMAVAIMASSYILAKVQTIPFGTLFNIIFQAIALGVIGVALSFAFKYIAKTDLTDYIKGGLAIVIIAGTIALASQLISLGDYKNSPSISWSVSSGLSLLAFGLAALGLGAAIVLTGGIGALAIAAGCLAIVGIAETMVAVADVLGGGKWSGAPPLEWSASVAISLAAFGLGALALGAVIVGSLGVGYLALKAGNKGIIMIAETMVEVADKLRGGNFTGGPKKEWSEGIALALGAFSPVYSMLVKNKLMSLFGGGIGPKDFSNAIILVSDGILTAAQKFADSKGVFKDGPPKSWAEGVGIAIGAFAPVYDALADSKSLFGGPSPEDMVKAIDVVTRGIIQSAITFADNKAVFDPKMAPDEGWAKGVAGAIGAFAPAFEALKQSDINTKTLKNTFTSVVEGIVEASQTLKGGDYTTNIPENFMKNLSNSVKIYMDMIKNVSDVKSKNKLISDVVDGIRNLFSFSQVTGMERLAKGVDTLSEALNKIDADKLNALKNLTGSVVLMSLMDAEQFNKMMDAFESKAKIFVDVMNDIDSKSSEVGKGTKGAATTPVRAGKGPAGPPPKNMDDLYNVMTQAVRQLGVIAKSNDNLSKYVDEVRSGDNTLKKNKMH